jgi:hypothetical protein
VLFVMLHSFLVLVFYEFVFALLNDCMIILEHVVVNGRMIIEICERKLMCPNLRYVLVFCWKN